MSKKIDLCRGSLTTSRTHVAFTSGKIHISIHQAQNIDSNQVF